MLTELATTINNQEGLRAQRLIAEWDHDFREGELLTDTTDGIDVNSSFKLVRMFLEQEGYSHLVSAAVAQQHERYRVIDSNPMNAELYSFTESIIAREDFHNAWPLDALNAIETQVQVVLPADLRQYIIRDMYLRHVTQNNLMHPTLDGEPQDPFQVFVGSEADRANYEIRLAWIRSMYDTSSALTLDHTFIANNIDDAIPQLDFEDGYQPTSAMLMAIKWQCLIDYMRSNSVPGDDYNYLLKENRNRQGRTLSDVDPDHRTGPIGVTKLRTPAITEFDTPFIDPGEVEEILGAHLGFLQPGDVAIALRLLEDSSDDLAAQLSDAFMIDISTAAIIADQLQA